MARAWPLVGRDSELAAIGASIRPGSRSRGLVLAGPAGVGKTRLAREALELAAHRGAATRWVCASASSRDIPLGAFADIIDDPGRPAHDAVTRAVGAIGRVAGTTGLVVGVDDVHHLDELSAVLVQRLVVRGVATVLLTLREGEPVRDAVRALWKDEQVRRVDVRPLTRAVTAELLREALGGPVDSATAGRLWALTQGNVLFLRHLVDGEVSAGRLRRVEGLWCWQPSPAHVPPVLAEIVRELMGRFSDGVRDVVDLLALGEPLPAELLGRLTSPEAVEDAESAGLVRIDTDSARLQARLTHPLYGEVRRAGLGTLRSRRLRGSIATGLQADGAETSADVLRRAVLAADSDLPPDPALFLAASHQAVRLFDLVLGERLARAAVDGGGGPDAQLVLALSLSWLSRGKEADALLGGLAGTALQQGTRGLAVAARIGNLFWTLRRPAEAEAVLAGALAAASDESERTLLLAFRAALDASLGHPRRALQRGVRLLFPAPRDDHVALMAAFAVAAGAAVAGDVHLLGRAATIGDEAGRRAFVSIPRFGLGDWHVLGLRLSGDVRAALEVAHRLQAASEDVPGPAHLMGLVLRGHAELACGRVRTAERILREAWAGLRPSPHEFRFRCRTLLALALAMAGDATEARQLLAERSDGGHPAYALMAPDDFLAQAWLHSDVGATSRAVAIAHEAAALARSLDSPAFEVLGLQTALHFGDGTVAARLGELTAVVHGSRARVAAAHARALAAGDGDGLAAASGTWEATGDLLAAADAAAQAALAFTRAGLKGSASAAAARAHRLGLACEGARTPAIRAAARPLPLTAREREIATLAATGLSNRDIAELLVVSVRTVEGHLYRAGHKLGISDRATLGTLLGEGQIE
ncbi:LuxR C-terminal-related transcriptional regulator [Blastococcus deserti]|uniref:LuxR C-terminal-related transcriptional regulator n=1 Tax=Blastococcus deserti TaxID=2259033 RepID=A0ABW4X7Y3_9ACTN